MKPLNERIESMLAELRVIAKAEGVTDGPWDQDGREIIDELGIIACCNSNLDDAAFIARSRTITPAMAEMLIMAVEGLANIESTGAANKVWDATKGSKQAKNALTELCDKWEATK